MGVRVQGVAGTQRRLRDVAERMRKPEAPLKAAARALEAHVRREVPVKSGRLKRSIDTAVSGGRLVLTAGAEYASFVQAHRPFLPDFDRGWGARWLRSLKASMRRYIVGGAGG